MYLEGMEEASVFVHVAVNDVTGKVGKVEATEEPKPISSVAYRQHVTCGLSWLNVEASGVEFCAVSSLLEFQV